MSKCQCAELFGDGCGCSAWQTVALVHRRNRRHGVTAGSVTTLRLCNACASATLHWFGPWAVLLEGDADPVVALVRKRDSAEMAREVM